ncbi:hypothetical protein [Streptomyces sp. NPDC002676]
MHGRTSAPDGRPTALPDCRLPHPRLRACGGASTARGVAAAVIAVVALVAAANAGPARAADHTPAPAAVRYAGHP